MLKIGVLISGGGSNLQAIMDQCQSGDLAGQVVMVVSNRKDAYGLTRAVGAGIDHAYLSKKAYKDRDAYYEAIAERMEDHQVDLVVLAGYLDILPRSFVERYEGRIINIHPSLIPKYAGKGFYGMKVHRAVIEAGEKYSGATVHFVDAQVDTGQIILQESLVVDPEDTPESLQKKVLKIEHRILSMSINKFITNEL